MRLREKFSALFSQKLTRDIAWTIGSFAILATSGLVINVAVVGLRDPAALGVFNQAYAIYMVASQVAVFGLHYSVLRHAAHHDADSGELGRLLATAAIAAFVLGILAAAVVWLGAPAIGRYLDSESTGRAIAWSAAGLLLFPLNKVLVFYLNGLRRMKVFSVLQAARYLTVMACVSAVAASPLPFELVTIGLFVAELITTLGALTYIVRKRLAPDARFEASWLRRHFIFGGKSLFSGLFAEMNSRVDVLLLGFFMADRAVGIYSFVAMLVDGLYHVLAMVRVNFNPLLVAAVRDRDWAPVHDLLRRARKYAYPATGALAVCVVAGFFVLAWSVAPGKNLQEGLTSLVILLGGLVLVAPFVPFDNVLLATGHPAYQTFQQLTVILGNALLNVTLVPHFGIEGAALATAASYAISSGMMILLARRLLDWNLLTNRFPR